MGCANEKPQPIRPVFEDIEMYFKSEPVKLAASRKTLEKILITNGHIESQTVDQPDWKAELQPFLETFSGHQERSGSYVVDSMEIGVAKILKYSAKDSLQDIRNVTVFIHGPVTDSIIINKSTSNDYYKSSESLVYINGGNFRINTVHEPFIGKQLNILFLGRAIEPVQ